MARLYWVFNLQQTENVKAPKGRIAEPVPPRTSAEANATAEKLISGMPNAPKIVQDSSPIAFYRESEDLVHMVNREECVSDSDYYATLFHELVHSTGHKSRLNRFADEKLTDRYANKESRSREELVAEIGASMLSAHCDLFEETAQNSAAYINGWLQALKNDHKLIFWSAARAQKASDYIIGAEPEATE